MTKRSDTTIEAYTFDSIKGAAKIAALMARDNNDAMFILDTPYGPHIDNVGCWTAKYVGEVVMAVLPNGEVLALR